MATSRKPVSKSTVEPAAPSPKHQRSKSQPYLRFYHSDALRAKTIDVLAKVERAPDPRAHGDALADVVIGLTDAAMDYYFIKPLKLAKAGFIIQQSASLGVAGSVQVIGSVVRNVVGRMDKPQLLSICASIREFML